jgi:hypothetical protein
VGGNAEVVSSPALGTVVPLGRKDELVHAISDALSRNWDRDSIVAYAQQNSWDNRVEALTAEFVDLVARQVRADAPGRVASCD